jgi:hypothetical protein
MGVFCPTPNSKSIISYQNTYTKSLCGKFMAEINFNVDDEKSGFQAALNEIEDTLSVQNFLAELSQHGFGPFDGLNAESGLVVDEKSYPWTAELQKKQLVEIGVVEGCLLEIMTKLKVAR